MAPRRLLLITFAALILSNPLFSGEISKIFLQPVRGINRAEVCYIKEEVPKVGVLVLCPGFNEDGSKLIQQKTWQDFAKVNGLGLMGLSFTSAGEDLIEGKGYYYVDQGSGDSLLEAVRKTYGKDWPLLVYGFSGGAQFTSRFVEWKPDRVLAWCAYSAGWWDAPKKSDICPPGIVACGYKDWDRYGASLVYFKQGRAVGKPWLWVSLADTDHQWSPELDAFVRAYFQSILQTPKPAGVWVDIERKEPYARPEAIAQPSMSGWLPDEKLLPLWKQIHAP
jgi:pimeloyl-ACP methyl ester carboxylesterase